MNRATLPFGGFVLLLLLSCRGPGAAPPAAAKQSPVILISIDTLRADRLGAYGYRTRPASPNLDALAADGIVFERQISAAPWTPPAHASLLTSLAPSSHGVTASFSELRAQQRLGKVTRLHDARVTLAEALGAAGYDTVAFTGGMTMDPRLGFDQGFAEYHTNMFKLREDNVAELLRYVEARGDAPFFLFWHTFEVHAPYLGTRFLKTVLPEAKADEVRARVRRYEQRLTAGRIGPAYFYRLLHDMGVYDRDVCEALYVGSVARADRWVGRLVAELKRLGRYDDALVVVTSDHGEEFGEGSPSRFYDAHGHTMREELLRVPLIVKLPGGARAGARVRTLSRTVDVMPTVLDVLGVPVPGGLEGESLRAHWEGAARERLAFSESLQEDFEEKAVQDGRFKFVVRIAAADVKRGGRLRLPLTPVARQLFDLRRDPQERANLLDRRPVPAAVRPLSSALRRHHAGRSSLPATTPFDAETVEQIGALGYVDGTE